jgi:spectinomycin phosphotransferase
MLEKPDIPDAHISDCLRTDYDLYITHIEFLPLGADRDTAVYRATVGDAAYFVKLRRGNFDPTTVIMPRLLADQGVRQVIPPMPTCAGQLWARLDVFNVIVSPFVAGQDGYTVRLSDQQWIELGRALKGLHTAALPAHLIDAMPRETYSNHWRASVRRFQAQVAEARFADPVAAELAALMNQQRATINRLVQRAESLAEVLRVRSQPLVLCHADLHAGNVLIDARAHLYLVDWDTLIMAPVARDLMFVGGGLFANHRSPPAEEALFYQGYGPAEVDAVGLAYYRCERIVQDIAAYCEQILLDAVDGADRANGLRQFAGQFEPGQVIDLALQTEAALPPEFRAE